MAHDHISTACQQATQLAQAGDFQQAQALLAEHLKANPNDGKAFNDMGAILYSLGRYEEARSYTEKARSLEGDLPEILLNLVEMYLAQARPADAAELFDVMEKQGILNPELINRTANLFLNEGDKAQAIEMLLRSLRLLPNQEILEPMLQVIRSKRPKIAFFVDSDYKFIADISEFSKLRFPVEVFSGRTAEQMYDLMKWSDISWFEWCTNFVIEASKLPRVCRNIVRLHRWEAYEKFPQNVYWPNIDILVLVGNSYVAKALRSQVPGLDTMTRVVTIPNGINLEKFSFKQRTRGKNIAYIGYINQRKNPMFLLQCMQKLHYCDPEYKLYMAGNFTDPALEQYMKYMVDRLGLNGVVIFDDWQDNISAWLEDKHYLVSASTSESQGMGILEGMARGLKPIIHAFPGVDEIFGSEFLFYIAEDFCRQVLSDSYDPLRYREFVAARYPLSNQLGSINEIFTHFENLPLRTNREVELCRDRLWPFCSGKGIDVGCGDNKIAPEAIGIDYGPGISDITADARQLPFESGSLDYVFSSHCLEDLDDTGAGLAEWMRVLKVGGNLVLYLPHKNFYPRVGTPGANPHHKHDLDPNTVLAALSQTNDYDVLHLDETGTGGEHSFALVVKKRAPRAFVQKVLVEYDAVVGDIMCIEPAVRGIKQALGENTAITLRVTHPDLFRNHPCVHRLEHTKFPNRDTGYQRHFVFDWRRTPENCNLHLVERAARQVGVALPADKCPKIYLDELDDIMLKKFNLPSRPFVAIGADVRWPSRSWALANWKQLASRLVQMGMEIVQLGNSGEFLGFGLNLIDQTSPREAAAIISKASLAIAVDNGLAHLAAAVGTPRVGLFGPVHPELRTHAGPSVGLIAKNSDCRGCFHSSEIDIRVCPKGHNNCMALISVDDVLAAAAPYIQKR